MHISSFSSRCAVADADNSHDAERERSSTTGSARSRIDDSRPQHGGGCEAMPLTEEVRHAQADVSGHPSLSDEPSAWSVRRSEGTISERLSQLKQLRGSAGFESGSIF